MARQLLTMTHPKAGSGKTTLEAFRRIWEPKGWRLADAPDTQSPAAPRRSASKRAWVAYAVDQGMAPSDAEALTRNQLADQYLNPPPDPESDPDADSSADPDSKE